MRALVVLALVSAQALAPRRRTFLVAAAGGAASARASTDGVVREITLPEAVKAIITDANPDWVRAVVQAGFIYRGVGEAVPTLRRDAYDLYSLRHVQFGEGGRLLRSLDAALDKSKAPGPRARKAHLAVANAESRGPVGRRGVDLAPRRDGVRVGTSGLLAGQNQRTGRRRRRRVDEGAADCIDQKARSSAGAAVSPCPNRGVARAA